VNAMEQSLGVRPRRGTPQSRRVALVCALGLALAACAGPINAVRVDPKVVQADLGRSATTTGEPSWPTRNVLFERGLADAFAAEPEATLAALHRAMVAAQGDPDLLFALAELAYREAKSGFVLPGLGKLVVRVQNPRVARNPKTGEEIAITARRVVTFHASQKLKAMVEAANHAGSQPS